MNGGSTAISSSASYDENGFWMKGFLSPKLEGYYYHHHGRPPVFVINGDVLKKLKNGSLGTLNSYFTNTSAAMVMPSAGAISAPMVM
ncbi:unnamed protein product [Rotaria socialis]|nr:unnamed protein product [Rotaria socialis]